MAVPPDRAGTGLRKRLFAALLSRSTRWHEPFLVERKRRLLGDLHGDVVEIGPGTGVNLAYLPADVRWLGIEPNAYLRAQLLAEAARRGLAADVRAGTAERLPVADRGADAVVSTLVLCSVPDPDRALAEVRRVLRPGGRFVFVEHVGAPRGTWLRRAQRVCQPLWSVVADGCHPDRDTADAIARAGFARVEIEHFHVPAALASPHVAGTAIA
jgi:SAM-dependent methyltransferase